MDPNTSDRLAFYAKMLYRPSWDWIYPDKVRMVWLVQMLVDQCQESVSSHCISYVDANGVDKHNQIQVVQQYYDEWTLTGLNIREDHGVDYAVVYEDPAPGADDDLTSDNSLLALSFGLDAVFLTGRDCDTLVADVCQGDGLPDVTVAGRGVNAPTVAERFDRDLNSGVSEVERWNIPNVLQVVNKRYEYRDQAVGTLITTDAQEILNTGFGAYTTTHPTLMPSLMFVRDESYRTTNLAAGSAGNTVRWSGARLTVNLNANGGTPLQVMSGVKVAPYRWDAVKNRWESVLLGDYWDELDRRYAGELPEDSPTLAAGKVALVQLYYTSLYTGLNQVVALGGQNLGAQNSLGYMADTDVYRANLALKGTKTAVMVGVGRYFKRTIADLRPLQNYLGDIMSKSKLTVGDVRGKVTKTLFKQPLGDLLKKYKAGDINKVGVLKGVGSALTVVAVLVIGGGLFAAGLITGNNDLALVGGILLSASLVILLVVPPLTTLANLASAMATAGASKLGIAGTLLTSSSEVAGNTKSAGLVGLAISVGIVWGIFIYEAASGGVKPDSLAFDALLASTIAATILAILVFAVSLTLVGFIALLIAGVIDLFLAIFCAAGVDGACFSIFGSVTEGIASLINDSGITVDTTRDDLVNVDDFGMRMMNQGMGLRAGNAINHFAQITSKIFHSSSNDLPYEYRTEANLRSTTIDFKLATSATDKPPVAKLGDMKDEWTNVATFDWRSHYSGETTSTVSTPLTVLTAGLNQPGQALWLNMSFAFPGYSCWKFFALRVKCSTRTVDDRVSNNMGDSSVLDIFPATLDEFWGMNWDPALPAQKDVDGDGMWPVALGGADVYPNTHDGDGDGIPDAAEIDGQTEVDMADSDSDDLNDGLELILGTSPTQADSDFDGLSDKVEVEGWLFTYGTGKTTIITSDPLQADTDGDGLGDLAEKEIFRTNPNIFNTNTLGITTFVDDADSFLGAGQTYVFTATVTQQFPARLLCARRCGGRWRHPGLGHPSPPGGIRS